MDVAVIIPFRGDAEVLLWTLEGFARQELPAGMRVEVRVHGDGVSVPAAVAGLEPQRGITFATTSSEHVGSAEAKNLLLRGRPCDAAIIVNADTRPAPGFIRNHIDRLMSLPEGMVVLGAAPYDRGSNPSVFDVLKEETPMIFFYGGMRGGELHDFRHVWTLNLSVRYADLQRINFFNPLIRPVFFEDLDLGHRLMGNGLGVYFDPSCVVTHRHPMTLEQYLNREELLGMMAPVLHQANVEAFESLYGTRDLPAMAEKFQMWCAMDRPGHAWILRRMQEWCASPESALGVSEERRRIVETIYQMHVPLKRLAFRLGFLRGMELREDSRWKERIPTGLWREALSTSVASASRR